MLYMHAVAISYPSLLTSNGRCNDIRYRQQMTGWLILYGTQHADTVSDAVADKTMVDDIMEVEDTPAVALTNTMQ